MLDGLSAVVDTLEFEENGPILAMGFERDGASATLRLLVRTGAADQPEQVWQVDGQGVEGFAFDGSPAYEVEVVEADPALWGYSQPQVSLYCANAVPDQTDTLIGALYYAHVGAVGEAIGALPSGTGLNPSRAFRQGAGLVARGPLLLLQAYQEALEARGVSTSIAGKHTPRRWDGRQWVRVPESLRLLVLGSNWMVAQSFSATRTG